MNFALRLLYNDSQLIEIHSGPTLTKADVNTISESIKSKLLDDHGYKVGQAILFCPTPVSGHFRYQDRFQILPVPPEAPKPAFLAAAHPFILQFRFRNSPDWMVRNVRRAKLSREMVLVLTGLTSTDIYEIGMMANRHWVLLPSQDNVTDWRIAYCQEMYTLPQFQAELDNFSEPIGLEAIPLIPAQKYYSESGITGAPFHLPDWIHTLCDKVFALAQDDHRWRRTTPLVPVVRPAR